MGSQRKLLLLWRHGHRLDKVWCRSGDGYSSGYSSGYRGRRWGCYHLREDGRRHALSNRLLLLLWLRVGGHCCGRRLLLLLLLDGDAGRYCHLGLWLLLLLLLLLLRRRLGLKSTFPILQTCPRVNQPHSFPLPSDETSWRLLSFSYLLCLVLLVLLLLLFQLKLLSLLLLI